jgi:hypothetical protein
VRAAHRACRIAGIVSLIAGLAACGSPSAAAPRGSESGSSTPPAPALAAVWTGFPNPQLQLLDMTGRTVARVRGWAPRRASFRDPPAARVGSGDSDLMPYFSSSHDRLYYLVGDGDVHVLGADGSTRLVKRLRVGSLEHAGFAVSADDRTMAVAIIDYAVSPHHLRLYTEHVADGGGHRELISSSARFEWPIAFIGADLLMAVGPTGTQTGAGDPYYALGGYRLLHPDGTVVRSFCAPPAGGSLGGDGASAGPVDPDGAICASVGSGGMVLQPWSGGQARLPDPCGALTAVSGPVYSPSRTLALCAGPGSTVRVLDMTGRERYRAEVAAGDHAALRYAWIDDGDVVVGRDVVHLSGSGSLRLPQSAVVEWRVPGDAY